MCSQTQSSTGYSPMRMPYNKDPILPFEMADKLENGEDTLEFGNCNDNGNIDEDNCMGTVTD